MKILRKMKKGFTIVELVIVIAVIAVLTAILVPTFINISKKANQASDQSLKNYLNKALALVENDPELNKNGENKTMHYAIEDLDEYGITLSKIVTKSDEKLVWKQADNRFYFESEIKSDSERLGCWRIQNSIQEGQKFSVYAGEGYTSNSATVVSVGFDAGYKTNIKTVNYSNDIPGRNVVIRTNGGQLNIGTSEADATGKILHYGTLDEAIIYTTDSSFHTHGKIASMDLKTGRAVAEDKGYVALVKAAENTIIQEVDTGVFYIPSNATTATVNADVAATLGYTVTTTGTTASEERTAKMNSTDFIIMNADELSTFRDMVNSGNTFAGVTVKLSADIDLDGYDWTPIGIYKELNGLTRCKFSGTFDGQGHTIDNMHIIGLDNSNGTYKSSYSALFGYTNGIIKNFTLKGSVVGTDIAAVVGALSNGGQILNVNSYVMLTGITGKKGGPEIAYQEHLQGKVAGFCIMCKDGGASATYKIEECNNYGDISTTTDAAGGILSWYDQENSSLTINKCNNYGNISNTKVSASGIVGSAGGIIGHISKSGASITDCTNYGLVTELTGEAGGIAGSAISAGFINCENRATITGKQAGGIAGSVSGKREFTNLKNIANISGSYSQGEIFGTVENANIDANEFDLTDEIKAIGVYRTINSNVTRVIENADDNTIGQIIIQITANTTTTIQIKNSTISTLKFNPIDNHSCVLELNNSTIETLDLNDGVTNNNFGYTITIKEVENTENSLGNVNLLGALNAGRNGYWIYAHLGVACTLNNNTPSSYLVSVDALEGYSVASSSTNVWVSTKSN